jgi:hypothetical protein
MVATIRERPLRFSDKAGNQSWVRCEKRRDPDLPKSRTRRVRNTRPSIAHQLRPLHMGAPPMIAYSTGFFPGHTPPPHGHPSTEGEQE